MDLTNAFGAEFREVADVDHQGKPARAVIGARTYASDINDLWTALTQPNRIARWFTPVTGDLQEGGHYQLEGNASGKITHCAPPKAFDVTWEMGDNISFVSVRLTPDGEGVKLTLTHTLPKDEASEAHWKQYGPGATGVGWDLSFLGMALYVASDDGDIDRAAIFEWMASEPGKDFMRASATAWGEAHITSGENPDTARAVAHSTAAFYTGA